MKEQKELKIRYRSGLMHSGDIDGKPYKEYEYDYVSVSISHTKRFSNALMLLMGISGCDLHLMDWLSENMSDKGLVNHNEITRKAFIAYHDKNKGKSLKSYGEDSVKKSFRNLVEAELLVPITRGVFQVNPIYFFSGDESDRVKSIKLMMEFKAGVETSVNVETIKKGKNED